MAAFVGGEGRYRPVAGTQSLELDRQKSRRLQSLSLSGVVGAQRQKAVGRRRGEHPILGQSGLSLVIMETDERIVGAAAKTFLHQVNFMSSETALIWRSALPSREMG